MRPAHLQDLPGKGGVETHSGRIRMFARRRGRADARGGTTRSESHSEGASGLGEGGGRGNAAVGAKEWDEQHTGAAEHRAGSDFIPRRPDLKRDIGMGCCMRLRCVNMDSLRRRPREHTTRTVNRSHGNQ